MGGQPQRVAVVGNTSHGLSLIANGLPWRDGDEIVVSPQEFPSNHLIWQQQCARGARIVDLPMDHGCLTAEGLARVISPRTRVVAISHVQYHNGFRADIAAMARVARDHGALLVVDGTQSIGAMEFDLDGWDVDALVVSAHKWMLCPKGIGLMLLSARAFDRIAVTIPGWQSVNDRFAFRRQLDFLPTAARFESGTENAPGRFALAARLSEIRALGTDTIAARILALRDRLARGLPQGWTPTSPDQGRSGILTVRGAGDAEAVVQRLEARGIRTSARGGAVRISPHVYTTEEEIDLLLDTMAQG